MAAINRLLIANRGEIACRIMRTAKDLGIETVAVYSQADKNAPHVRLADQAVCIGPPPTADSYLVIQKITDAAKATGADAVHPGYGFLSENVSFATACREAGLTFVGPPDKAIDVMGDKARAKRAMIAAGVPCVPGYQGEDQSDATLIAEADAIGLPLMVKAAAGGGGRGMRLVERTEDLAQSISLARKEAETAFDSDELIIEKAILRPRHVEIQVFGDQQGNIIHLGERDCSVQRRHQKVVEEAPCPVMTPDLRDAMGKAAVNAAKAVDYVGAGTVEFLLGEDHAFYFLEMNTRLQVEHPVTEAVTGLDLVALQLHVAAGAPLGLAQSDIHIQGHAIEVRLYAEDPQNNFLPSTGRIDHWRRPEGAGVRLDAGVTAGDDISPFYDPMVAKVIGTGMDREQARRRLVKALQHSALIGPANNRDFLIDVLKQKTFAQGGATTAFIEEEYGDRGFYNPPALKDYGVAAFVQYKLRQRRALAGSLNANAELTDWASNGVLSHMLEYERSDGETLAIAIAAKIRSVYNVSIEGQTLEIIAERFNDNDAVLTVNGVRENVLFYESADGALTLASGAVQFAVRDLSRGDNTASDNSGGVVASPMHGLLLDIFVKAGDVVEKGQRLAVVEAMKMMHEIVAETNGEVSKINLEAPSQIATDDIILEIEPSV
ncbi:MAG: acetyl-CoA carboxylase biotin carboxylase subunit [Pseudomonadota bacterium]